MATLKQIVSSLAIKLGKDNDFGFLKYLEHCVNNWRATIIKQDVARGKLPELLVQEIIAEVEEVPLSECPLIECPKLLRTKLKVPQPIRTTTNSIFSFVGTVLKNKTFSFIMPEHQQYMAYSRWTKSNPNYAYFNEYIYIYNIEDIEYIKVRGIFENPSALSAFTCNDVPCFDWDQEYPVTADILQRIEQAIIATELRAQGAVFNREVDINETIENR